MDYDVEKMLVNIRDAGTDDLIDRVTAYRAGMEATAIELINQELYRRGVTAAEIAAHRETCDRDCIFHDDGTAKMCSFCRQPAVGEGWRWHKILGTVPVFPRILRWCREHRAI